MSASLTKHNEMLLFLGNANSRAVKAVLKTASPELIQTLCECFHNVLKGNFCLNQRQKNQLCQHKLKFRILKAKKTSLKKRMQILQTSGFVDLLFTPLLVALKGLLTFYNGQENDFHGILKKKKKRNIIHYQNQ